MITMTEVFGATLENLATLIVDTDAFQTWTDSEDAAEARSHIHFFSDLGSKYTFPSALLELVDGIRQEKVSESGGGDRSPWPSGALRITFYQDWDPDYILEPGEHGDDPEQAVKDFVQNIGLVLTDMWTLSGTASYLSLGSVTMTLTPKTADTSQGEPVEYLLSVLELELG